MVVKKLPSTLIIKVTVPAGQAPNSILNAQLIDDPMLGAQSFLQLSQKESWATEDMFIKASGDVAVDGIFIFKKNNYSEIMRTPPISTMLVSNPQRPRMPKFTLGPSDKLSVQFINLASGGGSDQVNTFYVQIVKFYEE